MIIILFVKLIDRVLLFRQCSFRGTESCCEKERKEMKIRQMMNKIIDENQDHELSLQLKKDL